MYIFLVKQQYRIPHSFLLEKHSTGPSLEVVLFRDFFFFFIAMVMIQYINLEQCAQGWSQDWSQARTFAGASMFICGSWVELSSDARAKRGTVFLSFLSPRLIAASLRRRNDHFIMILVKKGFFSLLLLFLKCCVCSFSVCTCYAALGHFFYESTSKLEQ